ncbi:hypothetical protein MYX65_11160 [Acidobacteria bacterium AH-259-L09]|nr:hypothetical protein [Acidobacteria bacterium AH-259-L09]
MNASARPTALIPVIAVLVGGLGVAPAQAQHKDKCVVLCMPELKFEPTVTITNLFSPPTVAELEEGRPARTTKLKREVEFELIFAVDIPTEIPRLGLTVEAIWTPFVGRSSNVFTGATAAELGVEGIDDNPVELEIEVNLALLEPEQTGGWLDIHFDIVDQFSPSERPQDTGLYTHKLNFELDTAVAFLNWLPKGNWLRNLELEWSLDYLATGIPQAGDEVPRGEELFLTDASPWSLSMLVVIPIAPLSP